MSINLKELEKVKYLIQNNYCVTKLNNDDIEIVRIESLSDNEKLLKDDLDEAISDTKDFNSHYDFNFYKGDNYYDITEVYVNDDNEIVKYGECVFDPLADWITFQKNIMKVQEELEYEKSNIIELYSKGGVYDSDAVEEAIFTKRKDLATKYGLNVEETYEMNPVFKRHKNSVEMNPSFNSSIEELSLEECKSKIEKSLINNHYGTSLVSTTAKELIEKMGTDNLQEILSLTITQKSFDGRISKDNKEWAASLPPYNGEVDPLYLKLSSDAGLINNLANQFREELKGLSYTKENEGITRNIVVEEYYGSWYIVDSQEVEGKMYHLCEHETHGDETANIILNDDRKLVMSDVWNGFDDLVAEIENGEWGHLKKLYDGSPVSDYYEEQEDELEM